MIGSGRDFSIKEKIMLLILVLFLMGGAYYYLVDQPLNRAIEQGRMRRDDLEMQLSMAISQRNKLERMQQELDSVLENESLGVMGSYDNKKEELDFLNSTLSEALNYSLSIQGVTREADLLRRAFTLQYTTATYEQAVSLIDRLNSSRLRCLVGDIQMTTEEASFGDTPVVVSLNAVFYETMYGAETTAGIKE